MFLSFFQSLSCHVVSAGLVQLSVLYAAGCIPPTFLNTDVPLRPASSYQPRKLFITFSPALRRHVE